MPASSRPWRALSDLSAGGFASLAIPSTTVQGKDCHPDVPGLNGDWLDRIRMQTRRDAGRSSVSAPK